jgi:hypothetical protein
MWLLFCGMKLSNGDQLARLCLYLSKRLSMKSSHTISLSSVLSTYSIAAYENR